VLLPPRRANAESPKPFSFFFSQCEASPHHTIPCPFLLLIRWVTLFPSRSILFSLPIYPNAHFRVRPQKSIHTGCFDAGRAIMLRRNKTHCYVFTRRGDWRYNQRLLSCSVGSRCGKKRWEFVTFIGNNPCQHHCVVAAEKRGPWLPVSRTTQTDGRNFSSHTLRHCAKLRANSDTHTLS
jgi:hypothetical protein